MTIQAGDTVEFLGGVIPEQVKWAGSDYPSHLIIGRHYVVESVKIYPSFTHITLEHKQGTFNSVHFKHV